MLIQLGARRESLDVLDLLLDCHAKIRRFIGIAKRLAVGDSNNLVDIADAAGAIARYFSEAFVLHVADETELLLPRLVGRDGHVDEALAMMQQDHVAHAGHVAALTALCTKLRDEPARLPELAPELRVVLSELDADLETHLRMEETLIFPMLDSVGAEDKRLIMASMRDRRGV